MIIDSFITFTEKTHSDCSKARRGWKLFFLPFCQNNYINANTFSFFCPGAHVL